MQNGLEARVELQEAVGVVEDQHAAVGEVVVERLDPCARDVLYVFHDGPCCVTAPFVCRADGVFCALLEDQEAFGLQDLADFGHDLVDALFGVGLLDAQGDDVVDDFFAAQQALALLLIPHLAVLQVGGDGEARGPAIPRHEGVALQDGTAREAHGAAAGAEGIPLQDAVGAVGAGGCAPGQQLIAFLTLVGIGCIRQVHHAQHGVIEKEEVVGGDVGKRDAIV